MTDPLHVETGAAIATKLAPPVTVSLASIGGYPVSDVVLWITLFYTLVLTGHKLWQIWREVTKRGRS